MELLLGRILAFILLTVPATALAGPTTTRVATTRESLRIDAAFPGGNIIVDRIDGDRVFLRPDRRDTPRFWFYWYFRVRGSAGRTITFTFTDGVPIGARGPAVSTDGGRTWRWLGAEAVENASFTYAFARDADEVRFCFTIPYLEADWRAFLGRHPAGPHLETATLCRTRKGRNVECLHVGRLGGSPAHRVLLTARHHACETIADFVLEGIVQSVLADEEQAWLRENVEFLIVPFVDKDGVEDGDQGKLRAPRDPNRDYAGESIYPATQAIRELVPRWADGRLRVAIDLHCPYIRGGRNETVFFVGVPDAAIWRNVGRLSAILESLPEKGLPYRASDNLPFGQEWNNREKMGEGKSFAEWAAELPGVEVAATLEVAYANVHGTTVTPRTARAFGHDLARAIRLFLQQAAAGRPARGAAGARGEVRP
jgi:hypothetical protein